jgi:hypothetical protein
MLRAANDVKPLSVDMEEIGSRLEVRIAEIDSLLRSAWSLARDHGGPEIAESVRNSIATAEVMSVALRKAIRPMRKGVTSFRSTISTMRSWRSITDD